MARENRLKAKTMIGGGNSLKPISDTGEYVIFLLLLLLLIYTLVLLLFRRMQLRARLVCYHSYLYEVGFPNSVRTYTNHTHTHICICKYARTYNIL